MKFADIRDFALSLPETTEAPHHHYGSFRVRGRIFVTAPPEQDYLHVFVADEHREPAVAMYPEFIEKLFWGGRVVGLRITLSKAKAPVVRQLVRQAWEQKAPKRLRPKADARP